MFHFLAIEHIHDLLLFCFAIRGHAQIEPRQIWEGCFCFFVVQSKLPQC